MRRIRAVPAAVLAGLVIAASAFGQNVHLKARTIQTEPATSRIPQRTGRQSLHMIVQFDHPPGVTDIANLLAAGAQVTAALPDNAVVVSGNLNSRPAGVRWTGPIEAADRISPAIRRTSSAPIVVEFHSDITQAQQSAIEAAAGVSFQRPSGLLPNHAIAQATAAQRQFLAQRDEVAYLFPAAPELLNQQVAYPCAGMLTTSGPVPQYSSVLSGWETGADRMAHLSYYFASLTAKLPTAAAQGEIQRAMNQWAAVANVSFTPIANSAQPRNISIEFAGGSHGDNYPFDGPGGMLAHTFYPAPVNAEPIAGDMHFDADESWKIGSDTDLYTVALHELGHAIGLTHSDNPGDVMYPYYHRGMTLSPNDIGAARELYPLTPPVIAGTSALTLTLDPVVSTTTAGSISLTGMITGGTGPDSLQWQTNHGAAGTAAVSAMGSFTAGGIPLVAGANTLTLSAVDAAGDISTRTASVTLQQPASAGTTTPLSISIAIPVCAVVTVNTPALTLSGSAGGGAGITRVTWQTSSGATGVATGTTTWVASNVPLLRGTNTIIMRAYDAKGAASWVATVAVRP